jgi:hypothetical protein
MSTIFQEQSSSSEEKEEVNVSAECSFIESDREEFNGNFGGDFKNKWKIDFGL